MTRKVTGMSIRYNSLKKQKEIELLTKNNQIQSLSISRERFTKQVFITGFFLVSALFVLLFRNYLYLFSFWKRQKYIGRYRILEEVGAGGMGTIYKAHNARNKKETAAIKVLKPELFPIESNRKRFKQEGEIIDKLHHPHIFNIIERGEDKGRLFIAMEYLEGKTLKSKIQTDGQMKLEDCLYIMIQVVDALVLVHDKNIIHRDLNPSNLMLIQRDGDSNYVKLLDFGLSRTSYQTRLTMTGMVMGTVDYLSPEQVAGGELSTATDVYCLGATFYEMVTGQPVYSGETIGAVTQKIIDNNPQKPKTHCPRLPEEINRLIL
jgi:eukaryotic-like serine/threonine-protein kinase